MSEGFVYSVETETDSVILHYKTRELTDQTKRIPFKLEFFMKKPSFVSETDFKDFLRNNSIEFEEIEGWKDGEYCDPFKDPVFFKFSKFDDYFKLKEYAILNSYPNFENYSFDDEVNWNNSVNPFRFSAFIRRPQWQYILSTRRNISICGVNNMETLQHIEEDFDCFIKLLSYDIETFTLKNMNPKLKENEIMCIGITTFILDSAKPKRRLCIITKDFKDEDVREEYSNDEIKTEYIRILGEDREKKLLQKFIEVIRTENPLIVCGFNNFGFDDNFIFERCKLYGIEKDLLRLVSYDNSAKFGNIQVRIDGVQRTSYRTFIGNKIFFFDAYVYMLKSNPKLYNQKGKGNLNAMLSYNKIKSPYNESEDIQKTGLDYKTMFEYWIDNRNIYDIAYYCMNDALCAGLLLIKMGLLQDKIKLGELSCTSFSDALYREVNKKVLTKIEEFAWNNKFMLADDPIFPRE